MTYEPTRPRHAAQGAARKPARAGVPVAVAAIVAIVLIVGSFVGGWLAHAAFGDWPAAPSPGGTPSDAATPSVTPTPTPTPPGSPTPTPAPFVMQSPLPTSSWKTRLTNGPWPTSHVQGIAVDQEKGFVYYSFTTLLVKTTLDGKVVGSVSGFTGHLGDLAFNPNDKRVYGSLEYKDANAFYIAVFDVDKITRTGINGQNSDVVSAVYLPEVVKDFSADLDGDGRFAGDTPDTKDHRYGCSGIDGTAIGPAFGSVDGKPYLTVAYGIYKNNSRNDNDYQVLLQYDLTDWGEYELPLVEGKPHRQGPKAPDGKYFVYTGNTDFGVQSLEYDPWDELWLLAAYPGSKPGFPNYTLFAVDADARPTKQKLKGNGDESGLVLPLADQGRQDKATGIRGWTRQAPFGIQALGPKLFYVASSTGKGGSSGSVLTLETWTGSADAPFKSVG